MSEQNAPLIDTVGLVGLGLMGRGIAACLLSHGFKVVAFNRTHERTQKAREFIDETLRDLVHRHIARERQTADWEERFRIARSFACLAECPFVIESIKEDIDLKRSIYAELEEHLPETAVIASNTSSFPLELLQKKAKHPERFVVMHWSEPAWITRFMEIVRNDMTSEHALEMTKALGVRCDKEPSVLNLDIRGFITNRLMYAFIREACHLYDIGAADIASIDRSFRNDVGWWASFAGPFRWMDLTGIQAYGLVMEGLLPDLSNRKTLPKIMKKMMDRQAEGIANQKGFYPYTKQAAEAWADAWIDFTYDVRKLVDKYEKRLRDAGALEE